MVPTYDCYRDRNVNEFVIECSDEPAINHVLEILEKYGKFHFGPWIVTKSDSTRIRRNGLKIFLSADPTSPIVFHSLTAAL